MNCGKVYLLQAGDLFKIGITRGSVKNRIKQLSTGNPINITIVSTYESDKASKVESVLHNTFKSKKVKGEWFKLEDDDIKKFTSLCEVIENNIKLLEDSNTWYQNRYNK